MLAIVTGASAGIGEAFAQRLAAEGWELAIVARRRERLAALAQRLEQQYGTRVQVHVADLADAGDVAGLERMLADADVGMLVNNAGFAGYRRFVDIDSEVVDGLIGVHVLAVTRLTRCVLPGMVARGSGAVINIASLLAFSGTLPPQPLPYRATYAGAKAYLVTFTQALAGELSGSGVQLQVCCPGLVETEFHVVAGVDTSRRPFPVLAPGEIVSAALEGLRLNEVVCVPGLQDPTLLDNGDDAQRTLFLTAVASGLADRYRQMSTCSSPSTRKEDARHGPAPAGAQPWQAWGTKP